MNETQAVAIVPENEGTWLPPNEPPKHAKPAEAVKPLEKTMAIGDIKFGVTCTGEPVGTAHYLADSMACGDAVMALPSSVLVAGRTKESKGVAVDMCFFLDAIVEGAAKHQGIPGIAECSDLPSWVIPRLFGTFPALLDVYHEALDMSVLTVEAAGFKAACGMHLQNKRKFTKTKTVGETTFTEEANETIDKYIPPDATLSRLILTSRMKGRYKDEGAARQAVQINIIGSEARL